MKKKQDSEPLDLRIENGTLVKVMLKNEYIRRAKKAYELMLEDNYIKGSFEEFLGKMLNEAIEESLPSEIKLVVKTITYEELKASKESCSMCPSIKECPGCLIKRKAPSKKECVDFKDGYCNGCVRCEEKEDF